MLFRTMGGTAACRNLAVAFYARVGRDPLLRPLFPGKNLHCAIEAFAAFLVQFLGGPSEDTQRRWWVSLRESHLRFEIGPKERDAWMTNMVRALDDVPFDPPVRTALLSLFDHSSAYIAHEPVPSGGAIAPGEIAQRWIAQQKLDEAVAAIRSGDSAHAIALTESFDGTVLNGVLALMIGSGHTALLAYVHEKLIHCPALIHQRYAGRTLLHAATGNLATVQLLLRQGVDPNTLDDGGHTPLYCLANERASGGGADVVRALMEAGARVDANDGVKHCTALHMAARRGNVEIAEALLDSGANIEARDSLGETPLRRAVNCNKIAVAALLLSRGADAHSIGSKNMTPILAARNNAMRQMLDGGPSGNRFS